MHRTFRAAADHGLLPAETVLLLAVLAGVALAALAPPLALPAHYHQFADQRSAWGLPCAMDVLSNLGFVLVGAAGLWQLHRVPRAAFGAASRALSALFLWGLLLTAAGSTYYHWQPDDLGLAIDRAGMSVAFAGIMGLAAAERLSARAGLALAALTLPLAWLSAALPVLNGDMGPWAALQGSGIVLLAALAWRPLQSGALGVSLGAVAGIYVLAKLLDLNDQPVFELTGGLVSGHSLKHLVAALAALPLCWALWRAGGRLAALAAASGATPRPMI